MSVMMAITTYLLNISTANITPSSTENFTTDCKNSNLCLPFQKCIQTVKITKKSEGNNETMDENQLDTMPFKSKF